MRRRSGSDAHRAHAICEAPLHSDGAACTQLTSQTDSRTIAFPKWEVKNCQMAICNNPRVERMTPRSTAGGLLRRRRDSSASKEERKRERESDEGQKRDAKDEEMSGGKHRYT